MKTTWRWKKKFIKIVRFDWMLQSRLFYFDWKKFFPFRIIAVLLVISAFNYVSSIFSLLDSESYKFHFRLEIKAKSLWRRRGSCNGKLFAIHLNWCSQLAILNVQVSGNFIERKSERSRKLCKHIWQGRSFLSFIAIFLRLCSSVESTFPSLSHPFRRDLHCFSLNLMEK